MHFWSTKLPGSLFRFSLLFLDISTQTILGGGYIKKIFKMYTMWSIFYGVFEAVFYHYDEESIIKLLYEYCLKGNGHLWYLHELLIATIVFSLIFSKVQTRLGICLMSTVYFVGAVVNDLYNLLPIESIKALYHETYRVLFIAIPFFSIGAYLRKRKHEYKRNLIFWGIGTFVMLTVENFVLYTLDCPLGYQNNIFMLPLSIIIFYFFLQIDMKSNLPYRFFRELSTEIYLIHVFFAVVFGGFITNSLAMFGAVLGCSCTFGALKILIMRRVRL